MFKAPPFPAPALSFTSRRQQRSQVESRQLGPFRRGTELKAAEAAKLVPKRSFQTVQLFRLCARTSRNESSRRVSTANLKPKHGGEVASRVKLPEKERAEPSTARRGEPRHQQPKPS